MDEGRVTRITCRLNLSAIIYLGGEQSPGRLDSSEMKTQGREREGEGDEGRQRDDLAEIRPGNDRF